MREYISMDGKKYLFCGTVKELRVLIQERKEVIHV